MVGESVGNFRITKLMGGGGMGTVYLAEHPGLGRRAAVKVLHAELAATQRSSNASSTRRGRRTRSAIAASSRRWTSEGWRPALRTS